MLSGFTLWFTGLSGAGKTTIAEIVGPELERRGRDRRVPRRGRRSPAPLEGARLLEGGPRHEHRARRLGRLADHAAGRRGHRRRRSRRTRRRAPRRARWSRSSARSSRCTSTPRSTPAPSATSRVCTRRRSRVRSRSSPASPTRTRRPTSPELRVDTEAHDARGERRSSSSASWQSSAWSRTRCPHEPCHGAWHRDRSDRAARRDARRPHRRAAGRSRVARDGHADLARGVRPGHARLGRALAARRLHGQRRLRARRRGHAPRERPRRGRCPSASRSSRRRQGTASRSPTSEGRPLAVLEVDEVYEYDKEREAENCFRTTDEAHPGVARLYAQHPLYLAGTRHRLRPARARVPGARDGSRRDPRGVRGARLAPRRRLPDPEPDPPRARVPDQGRARDRRRPAHPPARRRDEVRRRAGRDARRVLPRAGRQLLPGRPRRRLGVPGRDALRRARARRSGTRSAARTTAARTSSSAATTPASATTTAPTTRS